MTDSRPRPPAVRARCSLVCPKIPCCPAILAAIPRNRPASPRNGAASVRRSNHGSKVSLTARPPRAAQCLAAGGLCNFVAHFAWPRSLRAPAVLLAGLAAPCAASGGAAPGATAARDQALARHAVVGGTSPHPRGTRRPARRFIDAGSGAAHRAQASLSVDRDGANSFGGGRCASGGNLWPPGFRAGERRSASAQRRRTSAGRCAARAGPQSGSERGRKPPLHALGAAHRADARLRLQRPPSLDLAAEAREIE